MLSIRHVRSKKSFVVSGIASYDACIISYSYVNKLHYLYVFKYIMQWHAQTHINVNISLFLTLDPSPSQVNVFVSVAMLAGKPILQANWTLPQSHLPVMQYEMQYRFARVRCIENNWISAPNITGSPPTTSTHLEGLTPGDSYLVRMRAMSASGSARWSSFDISGTGSKVLV